MTAGKNNFYLILVLVFGEYIYFSIVLFSRAILTAFLLQEISSLDDNQKPYVDHCIRRTVLMVDILHAIPNSLRHLLFQNEKYSLISRYFQFPILVFVGPRQMPHFFFIASAVQNARKYQGQRKYINFIKNNIHR